MRNIYSFLLSEFKLIELLEKYFDTNNRRFTHVQRMHEILHS